MFFKILLRRTHASRLSFNVDKTIDENLFKFNVHFIRCFMIDIEKTTHVKRENKLLEKLIVKNIDRHFK